MTPSGQFSSFRRKAMPALILVLGAGFSFFISNREQSADQERIYNTLDLRAEWRVNDFEHKVLSASVPVEAVSMFIASQIKIDQAEFHLFASQSRGENPVSRITWAPRVMANERIAFEAMAQNNVGRVGYFVGLDADKARLNAVYQPFEIGRRQGRIVRTLEHFAHLLLQEGEKFWRMAGDDLDDARLAFMNAHAQMIACRLIAPGQRQVLFIQAVAGFVHGREDDG